VSVPALYLLDTNITGYIVRDESPLARQILKETRRNSRVAISTISEAEILFGLERKPEARQLRFAAGQFLELVEVLPWDSAAASAYARLRNTLQSAGVALSQADLFIAAHAASLGAVLVSHDKAFQHVRPFISVTDWAADVKKAWK
jgi:tRNA(fMet)-specific endonuclease VapC